ncbi:MAG: peptidoglycan DD-metalloendopeptidase family protein [Nitrosomonas sp.]|nr:peptidoglycan DD-metalloendopeptidase family protein [Nitrosomonas sp.]
MKGNQTGLKVIPVSRKYTNDLIYISRYPGSLFINRNLFLCIIFLLLISCGTTQKPAPVVERSIGAQPQLAGVDGSTVKKGKFYTVQHGDTLYSIALSHGVDHDELAQLNGIVDPANIEPGQVINLSVPVKQAEPVLFALPQVSITPPDSEQEESNVKTHPKAVNLPYSDQNVAYVQNSINPPANDQPTQVTETARIGPAPVPADQANNVMSRTLGTDWIWPTTGKLSSAFSKNSKGVKISGQSGQSVVASASGEVVYSGHGLRGYGNLIIIKHNNTFLSAYAHNSKVLVKEGDLVITGQKIAEMGSTDTDTVQLHFEIRKYGKPVDPLQYLPKQPS